MSLINRFIDNVSRIGNDNCDLSNKNIQNMQSSNYVLNNHAVFLPMNNTINLATNQPN